MSIARIAHGVAKKTPSIALFIILAVLTFWGALSNWKFGYGFGQTAFEANAFASGSVAFDCLKVLAAAIFAYSISQRQWLRAAIAMLAYTVGFGWSALSAIGYMQDAGVSKALSTASKSPEYIAAQSSYNQARDYMANAKTSRSQEHVKSEILTITSLPLSGLTLPNGKNLKARTDGKTVQDWLVCELGKQGRGEVSRAYCPIVEKLYLEIASIQNKNKMQIQMALSASKMKNASDRADGLVSAAIDAGAVAGFILTPEQAMTALSVLRVSLRELGTLLTSLLFGLVNSGTQNATSKTVQIGQLADTNQMAQTRPFDRPNCTPDLIDQIAPPKVAKNGVPKRLIRHLSGVAENGKVLVTLGDISGAVGVAKNTARNALMSLKSQGLIDFQSSGKGFAVQVY